MSNKGNDKDVIRFPGNGSRSKIIDTEGYGEHRYATFDEVELKVLLKSPDQITARLAGNVLRARQERDDVINRSLDYIADRVKVLNEICAPNEKHCSCVPHLRARIKELEARVKELEGEG